MPRKPKADDTNWAMGDPAEQPTLDGFPSPAKWPPYHGRPVDRVDVAFSGFNPKDELTIAALVNQGNLVDLIANCEVSTHAYKPSKGAALRVVVTLIVRDLRIPVDAYAAGADDTVPGAVPDAAAEGEPDPLPSEFT